MPTGIPIEIVLLLLGILLLSLGIAILTLYLFLSRDLDQESAKEILKSGLPRVIMCLILIMGGSIVLAMLVPWGLVEALFSVLFLASSLWIWIDLLTWPSRKKRAGAVLVDMGPSKSKLLTFLGVMWVFPVIRVLLVYNEGPDGFADIFLAISSASLAVYLFLLAWVARAQFTEKGFFVASLVKWEQIKSYEWTDAQNHILTLRITRRLPLLGLSRSQTMKCRIPPVFRGSVDSVMAQHLLETQTSNIQSQENAT